MAREGPKVPVKKHVVKINRPYTLNNSSCEDPDHLSYSYSCLKSFKKNQNIIRDLVSLRPDQPFDRPSNKPMLFSLSGGRTQPIYQPFYNSKGSECDQISNYKFEFKENIPEVEQNPSSKYLNVDLEPDFRDIVDKDLLYKWLKYQFKCVNSLWPFSLPSNSIFSKLSTKNRTMKMEVFLSNVDEKTKYRLKRYVNNLNLSLEERSTLCNESLIEIDITPIMSDNTRLQEFLTFIHSIESNSTRDTVDNSKLEKKRIPLVQNQIVQDGCLNKQNDNKLKMNVCKNFYKITKNSHKINSAEPGNLSVECLYFSPETGDTAESEKGERKQVKNKEVLNTQTFRRNKKKKKYFLKTNALTRKCSVNNTVTSSSSYIQSLNIKTDNRSNVKKHRFNSTIPAKGQIYCKYDDSEIFTKNIQQESDRNSCNKLPVYSTKLSRQYQGKQSKENDNVNKCVQLEKTTSCKCLIHLKREDYKRYRSQCLFGKGESCNLRKYLSTMEKNSKSNIHSFDKRFYLCVKGDSKESQIETSASQNVLVNNKMKTNRQEQIEEIGSTTSLSSTTTKNYSSYDQTALQNDFQTKELKNVPGKYHICSRIVSQVEENYKNEVKVSSPFSNNIGLNKESTKCNPTEEMKPSSETLFLNDYRVIHIKDVEELVCEVSYSGTSFKSSTSTANISSKSSDVSCTNIIDKILHRESTNACFESLNYSINSISGGTVSDSTSKIKSSMNINSNDSNLLGLHKKENTSSINKLKSFETNSKTLNNRNENPKLLTYKNQNLKDQYSGKKVDYVKICHEHEKNFRRKRTSHSMEVQRRSFMKSQTGRELKSMGENNQNLSEKPDRAICIENNKITSKICLLENNTKELQSKITDLIEQLQLITKQNELRIDKENTDSSDPVSSHLKYYPKSTNEPELVLNSDDASKQSKPMLSVQKSNKKYLHFIKPQNIYNSISTIFKRSLENNNHSKKGKVPKNFNDNKNSINNSHERTSLEKEHQCRLIEPSSPIEVSPRLSHLNKKEEYFLILSNLEKLNTELKLQNNEIQILKKYLYNKEII